MASASASDDGAGEENFERGFGELMTNIQRLRQQGSQMDDKARRKQAEMLAMQMISMFGLDDDDEEEEEGDEK